MKGTLANRGHRAGIMHVRAEVSAGVDPGKNPGDVRREMVERKPDAVGRRAGDGHHVVAVPCHRDRPVSRDAVTASRERARRRNHPAAPDGGRRIPQRAGDRRIPAVVVGQDQGWLGMTQRCWVRHRIVRFDLARLGSARPPLRPSTRQRSLIVIVSSEICQNHVRRASGCLASYTPGRPATLAVWSGNRLRAKVLRPFSPRDGMRIRREARSSWRSSFDWTARSHW